MGFFITRQIENKDKKGKRGPKQRKGRGRGEGMGGERKVRGEVGKEGTGKRR